MSFPTSPIDEQEYNNHIYNTSLGAWTKLNKQKHWAFLGSPEAFKVAYVSTFIGGSVHGPFEINADDSGIIVLVDGVYEIRGTQRALTASTNPYISVSSDGSRTNLETRANAVWHHSHTWFIGHYTESYYLGPLSANEVISYGPTAASVDLNWRTTQSNNYGTLTIRRIS